MAPASVAVSVVGVAMGVTETLGAEVAPEVAVAVDVGLVVDELPSSHLDHTCSRSWQSGFVPASAVGQCMEAAVLGTDHSSRRWIRGRRNCRLVPLQQPEILSSVGSQARASAGWDMRMGLPRET